MGDTSLAERPRVLLVDDEEALVWSVSNRLTKLRPDYEVVRFTAARAALRELEARPLDLLITDIRMPDMTGLELIVAARRIYTSVPVIVVTAYPTADLGIEAALRSSIDYLQKPFELDRFIALVDEALERRKVGFSGAISVQTLPDIVQLYALSNTTGALWVRRRGVDGRIWFEHGAVAHALTSGPLGIAGEEAFHTIMLWNGGEFTMLPGEVAPERSIRASWTELLMESCRRIDDHRRSAESQGPVSQRGWNVGPAPGPTTIEVNPTEHLVVDVVLAEIEQNAVARAPRSPLEEINMANAKESLAKLDTLDGFIAAALVDAESGMILAAEGGSGMLNIEIAAAANTDVLRSKRKAIKSLGLKDDIEDILISLSKQYHLIRPLRAKPTLFFYLALDRVRGNLAMSRITLADVERDLQT
jgi:CheY-like chemotaxis protein